MKIASVILFLLMSQFGFSQFEINYGNISGFKLGASVSEISKLCGTNLSIPAEEFSFEFDVNHAGIEYHITFQEEEINEVKSMVLHRVAVKDSRFKTKEGAKIGMTKSELFAIYKNFYSFEMTRFLDTETFDYPKNKLMFIVDQKNNQDEIDFEDTTDYRILFLIIDDVVKEIQILDGFFI